MKIAVFSDTHNLLRSQVKEILAECDAVIHAGDFASQKMFDEIKDSLRENVPFYAVRGNNDRGEWAEAVLPLSEKFELQGVRFFLVHNRKDIPKDLGDVQIVIFGHSHNYFAEMREGKLWLNPGGSGFSRFHHEVTMAILYLEEDGVRVEKIYLEGEKRPARSADNLTEGKMVEIVDEIFSRMDRGQTIAYIASKVHLEEELVEQICRIRVTHPGVTPGGVVDKMEVNRVVTKSSK